MSENRTLAVFNATAATYDRDRMKLIPAHESFYAAALQELDSTNGNLVELGAGSGLFSDMLHREFPQAELFLIDFSEPMLALARKRLGNSPRVHFELQDYLQAPLPASGAIASSLSIHHLKDADKRVLFARVLGTLEPGGVFVNADQILQPTPAQEEAARAEWLREVRSLGATEQQIADSLLRQQEDRCATIDDQLAWLLDAGFRTAECVWRRGRFAVLVARKAT